MSIGERLMQLMQNEGMTQARFADLVGIQRSAVTHLTSGRNQPSFDVLRRILENFPHVNADWLLSGSGEMLKENGDAIRSASQAEQHPKPSVPSLFPTEGTVSPENRQDLIVQSTRNGHNQSVNEPLILEKVVQKKIEKIIIFYADNTFDTFVLQEESKE